MPLTAAKCRLVCNISDLSMKIFHLNHMLPIFSYFNKVLCIRGMWVVYFLIHKLLALDAILKNRRAFFIIVFSKTNMHKLSTYGDWVWFLKRFSDSLVCYYITCITIVGNYSSKSAVAMGFRSCHVKGTYQFLYRKKHIEKDVVSSKV